MGEELRAVMVTTKGKVIYLYRRDPQEALERLNRITGLRFARWPESLVSLPEEGEGLASEPVESGEFATPIDGVSA